MDVQSAANLNIPEGSVRNIHDNDKRLLWSAVGYNVRYDGDTTQQTYTGKNLFNISKVLTNSTRLINNGDGSITVNIPSNDLTVKGYTPNKLSSYCPSLNVDDVATLSFVTTGTTKRIYLQGAGANLAWDSGASKTITQAMLDAQVAWYGSGINTTATISNVQVELGSTATDYEPYVGGIPAPNPDYPQDVNVVQGKQDVFIRGENMFDKLAASNNVILNWVTGASLSNTGSVTSDYIPTTGGDQIKADYSAAVFFYDSSKALIGHFSVNGIVITSTGGGYFSSFTVPSGIGVAYIRLVFRASSADNPSNLVDKNIMVNLGSTLSPFEPYQGQTFPVDLIGKNLFSGWIIGKRINSNGAEVDDQNGAASDFIPVAANTNYTFSDIPDGLYTFIAAYNSQKQFLGRTGASGGSSSKGCKTISSYFPSGTPTGTGDIVYLRITAYQSSIYTDPISVVSSLQTQLEVGTSATPYVPYYNYELCKIGNYQDYIFKSGDDWYLHKAVDYYVLNSTTITGTVTVQGLVCGVTKPSADNKINGREGSFCSNATLKLITDTLFEGAYYENPLNFVLCGNDTDTLQTLRTKYGGGKLYYVLATPTDTKITDATLIAQLNAVHDWLRRYDYYGVVSGNLPIIINRSGII